MRLILVGMYLHARVAGSGVAVWLQDRRAGVGVDDSLRVVPASRPGAACGLPGASWGLAVGRFAGLWCRQAQCYL
jgi:hypothetical protein